MSFRGRGGWRGGYSNRYPDRYSDNRDQKGFGAQELFTKSLFIQSKKFYVDVRQNHRGKFVKISEVAPTGQKMRLVLDMGTAKEIHERLTDFCEFFSTLGPAKWDRSRMAVDEGKLRSEVIFREDRRYYLDLKENHRGRFLKLSMTLPNFERSQIVIPAQGMGDVRDVLTDILRDFGEEDSGTTKSTKTPTATTEQSTDDADDGSECITIDGKTFSFQIGENPRGKFVRISEVSPNFRTAITIPGESWLKFIEMVDSATTEIKSKKNTSG